MTKLTSLNLATNDISAAGITALAPSLLHLTNLTSLNLYDNSIKETDIPILMKLFAQMKNLKISMNLRMRVI
jgi:Leucine-rich repeat (LRR) protein